MRLIRNIKNKIKWFFQRRKRGFDDSELWNLDQTIARFILPRLKAFKKYQAGSPFGIDKKSRKKWDNTLDKMIFAFEKISNGEMILGCLGSVNDQKKVEEGLDLFRQYFFNLWD